MNFQSPFHRGNGCYENIFKYDGCSSVSFSPLFIGAMVATNYHQRYHRSSRQLSVPFSSGQWLLRTHYSFSEVQSDFQSPFHRGNGCYHPSWQRRRSERLTFSPLFIGAMVATQLRFAEARKLVDIFQSPFHRGNGCYHTLEEAWRQTTRDILSVPFSSGQWLLLKKRMLSRS